MIQETKLLGCLAQFALAGVAQTTPTAGTVSGTFIPDNAGVDASASPIWVPLGIISDVQEKVTSQKIKIFRPSPGSLVLSDVRETKFERELQIKVSEVTNSMIAAMRRSLTPLTPRSGALGQHVALTGGTIKGWLKVQSYNQDTNSQELAEQIWGTLTIDNAVSYGGDKPIEFPITFMQLWSSLNSATAS